MVARRAFSPQRRPRMVVAYSDSAHASQCARHFRRRGWEVHLANSGAGARQLVDTLQPRVIILDTQLPCEGCWLTCAELKMAEACARIFLVSPQVSEEDARQAAEVGAAAIVARNDGIEALSAEVAGGVLQVAG